MYNNFYYFFTFSFMGDIDSGKPTEGTIDIATATMHQIDAAIANNKLRLEMLERD